MIRKIMCLLVCITAPVSAATDITTFTENMEKRDGFIPFYYDSETDKVYLAVSRWQQPLLFQSSLPHGVGSNDIGLDRGQLGDTRLVQFERFGNKVMLRQLNTRYRALSDNRAEQQSINEAFADSVIAGFTVAAGTDNTVLIDYTPYLMSDIHGISERLADREQGNYQADSERSGVYLPKSKAFPKNTELEVMVTFSGSKPGQYVSDVTPDPQSLSVHLHHSFIALPEPGYEPRAFHPYSGFWKFSYFDYATAIAEPLEQKYIIRHRLQKKDPQAASSEPVEQIVYYLDPGIPEPVMGALKEGAGWWNQAFEAIGYENAFQVKVLPEDADPMDVRYNVIQWVHRATRGWSYGSSVIDPRTGELLKGHVTLGSLRVRQDYLIALGLTSPFTGENTETDPQQLMALARIRQLSAHEVGHTLGIAHNFAASENGRASVMDYPHPVIRLENGEIVLDEAYASGMGDWDLHAVAYGYQDYESEAAEARGLAAQLQQTREAGLLFKTDADTRAARHGSASGHMWDNGSDPLDAFQQISRVREHALEKMGLATLPDGASLSSLEDALVPVYLLHRYQLPALAKQIGGVEYSYELKGEFASPHGQQPVAPAIQKKALALLIDATTADFLRLPENLLALIPPTAFGDDITREHFNGRMGRVLDPVTAAESAADYALSLLLHPERLHRVSWQHSQRRGMLSVEQIVSRMLDIHWYQEEKADYGLNARLRHVVLNAVMRTLTAPELAPEVRTNIEVALLKFDRWLKKDSDLPEAALMRQRLAYYWETGEWPYMLEIKPLPPGSPI
ncbi:zinc-dependent metalloprotease [Alteromonas sp. ASW11-19]|uniref:Zinc-dependent metalloprotease n=1 Tax=Alteromonas salexigens TaxID=2982530 RepID=A0ABT2VTQ6_9ALTE|nr:zinc-dependent metalloprotease [Alteromonas salexigens]MCU7555823.1 zinc-dependent metalloprotease [Alteromonas salexigens]